MTQRLPPKKDFPYVTIKAGESYGTGDTTINLTAGHGTRLPDPAVDGGSYVFTVFKASNKNSGAAFYKSPKEAEKLTVTARSTDALTVTRDPTNPISFDDTYVGFAGVVESDWNKLDNELMQLGGAVESVKKHGAKGDGVTNDAAAIQAAIDQANTDGGGTVLFALGTYLITSKLKLYSEIKLHGAGIGATIIQGNLTTALIDSNAAAIEQVTIRDMTFDDTTSANSGSIGIDLTQCSETRVENCRVINVETGIKVDNSSAVILDGVRCEGFVTGVSVGPAASTNMVSIRSPHLENTPTTGTGISLGANANDTMLSSPRYVGLTTNLSDSGVRTTHFTSGDIQVGNNLSLPGIFNLGETEVKATLSSGAITVTSSSMIVSNGGGGNATLTTINGGTDGDILVLRQDAVDGDDITIANNTGGTAGQVSLSGEFVLDDANKLIVLQKKATVWQELSRSVSDGETPLSLGRQKSFTINSGGVITIDVGHVVVAANAATDPNDDLDTINPLKNGSVIALRSASGDNITVTENGNIRVSGTSRVLNSTSDTLTLMGAGSVWVELGYSDNG